MPPPVNVSPAASSSITQTHPFSSHLSAELLRTTGYPFQMSMYPYRISSYPFETRTYLGRTMAKSPSPLQTLIHRSTGPVKVAGDPMSLDPYSTHYREFPYSWWSFSSPQPSASNQNFQALQHGYPISHITSPAAGETRHWSSFTPGAQLAHLGQRQLSFQTPKRQLAATAELEDTPSPPQCQPGSPSPKRSGRNKRKAASKEKRQGEAVRLNDMMEELRRAIPCIPPNTKLTKIKTLQLASGYIQHLADLLEADDPGQVPEFRLTHGFTKRQRRPNQSVTSSSSCSSSSLSTSLPSPSSLSVSPLSTTSVKVDADIENQTESSDDRGGSE